MDGWIKEKHRQLQLVLLYQALILEKLVRDHRAQVGGSSQVGRDSVGVGRDAARRGQKRKRQADGESEGDQQPRPFRTDSPYPCLFCHGRFTLRHNLVRHAKRLHAADWNNEMYPSNRMIKKHGFDHAWELHLETLGSI